MTIAGRTEAPEQITLALAGKMNANALGELRRHIDQARALQKRVVLDLSEVTLVDRCSAAFLIAQTNEHVRVVNCPEYLVRWIPRTAA